MKSFAELKIFFSSEVTEIYHFLREFSSYFTDEQMKGKIKLIPYYIAFQNYAFDPNNRVAITNCISGGEFCSRSIKRLGIKDGRIILFENLRQKCIYNNYPDQYYNYLMNFHKYCLNGSRETNKTSSSEDVSTNFTHNCSKTVQRLLDIKPENISDCMSGSFSNPEFHEISPNKIYEEDTNEKIRLGASLAFSFAILVNNRQFRGYLDSKNVFEEICAGLLDKPDLCFEQGLFKKKSSSSISWQLVILIILLVLIINIVIYIFCRRYISKKNNGET